MWETWRHGFSNAALGGGNLLLLLVALRFPTPSVLAACTWLIGLTSLFAWHANLRRFRVVADTPTSRVSTAPQGYVELVGRGVHPGGEPLRSHLTGLPCLWYRYRIEELNGNKWRLLDAGVSHDTFAVDDGTGTVLVDPDGAEILYPNKQTWIDGPHRKTEWSLLAGETLYVLGEHVTLGGAHAHLDLKDDIGALLTEWKNDKPFLLNQFDLDGDGSISLEEWELARRAARRQVEQVHRETRLQGGIHLIRKPAKGLYLIASGTPSKLVSRYRRWAWAHLVLLFAAGSVAAIIIFH